jgi:hypothetical protein
MYRNLSAASLFPPRICLRHTQPLIPTCTGEYAASHFPPRIYLGRTQPLIPKCTGDYAASYFPPRISLGRTQPLIPTCTGDSAASRFPPYSSFWSTLISGTFKVRACSLIRNPYIIVAEQGYDEESYGKTVLKLLFMKDRV